MTSTPPVNHRYRSMDLLRAAAILLVILAHSVLSYGAPAHLAPLQLGGTGVDLFFVLSGWLLGGQLLSEVNRTGVIDVRRFWIRRWMRTLPAYFAVLLLSVAQRYLTLDNVEFPWQYFIFVQNYSYPLEFFSISWSLCVEEQFYLMVAPLLALLARGGSTATTITLALLWLLPSVMRGLGWYETHEETHVRLDGCIAGVLLAQIYHNHKQLWHYIAQATPYVAGCGLLVYISFYVARYAPEYGITNPNFLLVVVIFMSWVALANADGKAREVLYIPGAYYIATRSYAMYLLHPEVLALMRRVLPDVPFVLYLGLTLIGSIITSEILYRGLEKPVMDLRAKLSFAR